LIGDLVTLFVDQEDTRINQIITIATDYHTSLAGVAFAYGLKIPLLILSAQALNLAVTDFSVSFHSSAQGTESTIKLLTSTP
jgi:hypothetical protein